MPLTIGQFAERLSSSGLLDAGAVSAFIDSLPDDSSARLDSEQLACELIRQKRLTQFQAEQIYAGKGKSLTLGNYIILDKLGQGGMGMVLKAQHKRMKRLVALKMMSPEALKTPDSLQRFHREVEAAAKLRHPNIVAADDADEAKGTHFLVMEYVEGSDLSALVKQQGPLSVGKAIECIKQAARGLEFAHEHGVIHRDIKPANLLINAKGTVKILDMGLARIEGEAGQAELTSTSAVMGTVDYMAPEQAISTKSADARSDIYSLGISLWYLLTGKAAYDGDTLMAKLLAHRESPIPSLSTIRADVPAALDAVFQKMVAKQSQDRFQSMPEVVRALESCQSGSSYTSQFMLPDPGDGQFHAFMNTLESQPSRSPTARQSAQATATYASADPASAATILSDDMATPTFASTSPISNPGTSRTVTGFWNRRPLLIAAGVVGCLLVPVGAWTLLKNRRAQEVTNLKVPDNRTLTVQTNDPSPAIAPFDAKQARAYQEAWARHLGVPVEKEVALPGGEKLVMMLVPPGEFSRYEENQPSFRVRLTKPFYLGKYEVTQAQWQSVMGSNPSQFKDNPDHPVEQVSWDDIQPFLARLNADSAQSMIGFALPTEAQWEFACRAGSTSAYSFGDDPRELSQFAWFKENSDNKTHSVGRLKSNPFGLFDLHGNVWELCSDWSEHGDFAKAPLTDPIGPSLGTRRVNRGGGLADATVSCRSAIRGANLPTHRGHRDGFRLAASIDVANHVTTIPVALSEISVLEFDGVDDYVEVPTLSLHGLTEFTIETRLRPIVRPGKKRSIVAGLSDPLFALNIDEAGRLAGYLMRGRQPTGVFGPAFVDGSWHDVAVMVSGGRVELFIDGKPQPVDTSPSEVVPESVNVPRDRFLIGAGQAWDVRAIIDPFQGAIDELRVSRIVRHRGEYTPSNRLAADQDTLALYSFDEGSGSELKDSSGNNHHGRIVGASWGKGWANSSNRALVERLRYALEFNDRLENGNARVVLPKLLRPDEACTVEMYYTARSVSDQKDNRVLFVSANGMQLVQQQTQLDWSGPLLARRKDNRVRATDAIQVGQRTHLVGVSTGKEIRLFIDGQLVGQTTLINDLPTVAGNCYLGSLAANLDSFNPLDGLIDEVRISKGVRYTENFTPASRFESDANTLALYHFDEGTGEVLKDSSGNDHHGQIVGAKWVRVADSKTSEVSPPAKDP